MASRNNGTTIGNHPFPRLAQRWGDELRMFADHCRVSTVPTREGGWQSALSWRGLKFLNVSLLGADEARVFFYPYKNFHLLSGFLEQQAAFEAALKIRGVSFLPYVIAVERAFEVSNVALLE